MAVCFVATTSSRGQSKVSQGLSWRAIVSSFVIAVSSSFFSRSNSLQRETVGFSSYPSTTPWYCWGVRMILEETNPERNPFRCCTPDRKSRVNCICEIRCFRFSSKTSPPDKRSGWPSAVTLAMTSVICSCLSSWIRSTRRSCSSRWTRIWIFCIFATAIS